jgi:hypothetical protein
MSLRSIDHPVPDPIVLGFTFMLQQQQQAVQFSHMNELAAAALEAHTRILGHVLCTNLMPSHWLSTAGDCSAFIKLESEQHTNSFKVSTPRLAICMECCTLYAVVCIKLNDSLTHLQALNSINNLLARHACRLRGIAAGASPAAGDRSTWHRCLRCCWFLSLCAAGQRSPQ